MKLSIMTFNKMTLMILKFSTIRLGIMTLRIMTIGIMTNNLTALSVILTIITLFIMRECLKKLSSTTLKLRHFVLCHSAKQNSA
jgi:hypothetical protein